VISDPLSLEEECVEDITGSITPFWVGQKVNIIVTLVEIMVTFCKLQNVIRV
jgi:hypothetical protein